MPMPRSLSISLALTTLAYQSSTAQATQLFFSAQPVSSVAGVAIEPALQVEIRDVAGNLVQTARDAVTLSLSGGGSGAVLLGTRTVNAIGGVASFSGLSVQKAGNGYVVVATAGALTSATSAPFNISPAAASRLGFITQPVNTTTSGQPNVIWVAVQDEFGNTMTSATDLVGLELPDNPASWLRGGAPTPAINGIAGFGGVTVMKIGVYQLRATSGTLTRATSVSFSVTPGPPTRLGFVKLPTTSPSVSVAVQDQYANTVNTANNLISLTLGQNPANGGLGGTVQANAGGGVAYFPDVLISPAGRGYTLVATSGTYGSPGGQLKGESQPFDIVLGLTSVSSGLYHTCALSNIKAYCWGKNQYGELGNGSTTDASVPSRLPDPGVSYGGGFFSALAAGGTHTCAVAWVSPRHIYCWGSNDVGQLGVAGVASSAIPVEIPHNGPQGGGFTAVSAGYRHTCALTANRVMCWGGNGYGQLGDATFANRSSPTEIKPATLSLRFASVTTGSFHTCALATSGDVYCWGYNASGQLGDASTTNRSQPVRVTATQKFVAVAAGTNSTCALDAVGAAFCWGANTSGQLGDGTTTNRLTPTLMVGGLSFTSIGVGGGHACGIATNQAVFCWGANNEGQLGDGTLTTSFVPVLVHAVVVFRSLAVGSSHTCGTTDQGVYCWGSNAASQLGNGLNAPNRTPGPVTQ